MSGDIVVPSGGAVTLPGDWQNKLAEYARETQQIEQTTGRFFSTKSGVLAFGGTPIPNNTMDVVVIGSLFENVYYDSAFNSEQVKAPRCYAFSLDGNNMAPHENVRDKQNDVCRSCKWNKWESGDRGRGKACKNMRRLALLPSSALKTAEEIDKGQVGYLRVPVTSVKNWSAFAQRLAASAFPPFAVVTRVTLKPDIQTMIRLDFDLVRVVTEGEFLEALHKRFQAEKSLIGFPYPDSEEDAAGSAAQPTGVAVPPPPGKQKKF